MINQKKFTLTRYFKSGSSKSASHEIHAETVHIGLHCVEFIGTSHSGTPTRSRWDMPSGGLQIEFHDGGDAIMDCGGTPFKIELQKGSSVAIGGKSV